MVLKSVETMRTVARNITSRYEPDSVSTEKKRGSRTMTSPAIAIERAREPRMFSNSAEARRRSSRVLSPTCRVMIRFTVHRVIMTSTTRGSVVRTRIFQRSGKRRVIG